MSNISKITTLTIGQSVNVIVNILFMPFMARTLSYEDYGSYGQTLLIVSFIAGLFGFGLSQIIFVHLTNEKSNPKDTYTSNLLAGLLSASIGLILIILFANSIAAWFNNNMLSNLIKIYSFSLLFSIPNTSIQSFLIFSNKVKTNILILIFSNIIKIILVITAIQYFSSLTYVFIAIIISVFIQFILGFIYTKKHLSFNINKFKIIGQLRSGFPLGLTALIGMAILYTDGFMVSKMLGVKEYAIYRNGAFEVPFISTIYGSIAAIILPEVSKLWNTNKIDEIVQLKRKVIMNTVMLIYPILFFLLFYSKEIIIIYLGSKYEQSALIFAVFNLTLLIRINDYFDILIASKNTKYILYFSLIIFVLNVILNYIFVSQFGSVGAALSTVVCLLLYAFLHLYKSVLVLKTSIFFLINMKRILFLIFSSCVYLIVINFVTKNINNSLFKISLIGLLYFIIIYLFLIKIKYLDIMLFKKIIPIKIFNLIEKTR